MPGPLDHRRAGVSGAFLVMAAGVLWGTTGTAQALSPYTNSPWGLGAARLAVAAALLTALAGLTRRLTAVPSGARPHAALGAACVAAYQPAFFFGVRETGVAVGTLTAIGSAPLFAGLLGALTGARPGRRWLVATTVVIAGLCLLLLPGGALRFDPAGVLSALAAGAAYAVYTWAGAHLLARGVPPVTMLAVMFAAGALALAVAAPVETVQWFARPERIAVAGYLGVVATVVPYLLWARGLGRVRPAMATTLTLTEPLTAALLGVVVLGETGTVSTVAGVAVVCAGLLLTVGAAAPPPGTGPPPRSGSTAGSVPASGRRA